MAFDFGFSSKKIIKKPKRDFSFMFIANPLEARVSPFISFVQKKKVGSSARHLSSDGVDALPGQRPNIFGHFFDGDVTNAFKIENVLQVSFDMFL
jgi:hypothetical protein